MREHRRGFPKPERNGDPITGSWTVRATLDGSRRRLVFGKPEWTQARATEALRAMVERLGSFQAVGLELWQRQQAAEQPATRTGGPTFGEVAEWWTSGKLAREYPDHVDAKRDVDNDKYRFNRHVLPHVKDVPIAAFSREDAERVMRAIPAERSRTTRRHVAQLMIRVLALAVEPLRLRESSPLPKGFLPKPAPPKALQHLWPEEDAKLLACAPQGDAPGVPLCRRLLYGFLAREMLRASEAAGLTWGDLDLDRGIITLDENKTEDPRAWALDPGVVRALLAWRELRSPGREPSADALVFIQEDGAPLNVDRGAARFRADLRTAGVDRTELFEATNARRPIRLHDLRATGITIALAAGKTEGWVQDRTGHTTSLMLNKYRRVARKAEQVCARSLTSLEQAIAEFRPSARPSADLGRREPSSGRRDVRGKPGQILGVGRRKRRFGTLIRGFRFRRRKA